MANDYTVKPMDNRTLANVVQHNVANSIGYTGDTISEERQTALKYYRGDPFGDEQEGRSKVVSRDVAESVDSLLPSLVKVFTAGEQVVRFEPQEVSDQEAAEQATDYVNWVFNQQNDGFRTLYTWFKDALLQKTGVVKVWWDDVEKKTREEYHNLTPEEYDIIVNDPNIEIETEELDEDEYGEPGIHAVVIKTNKEGKCCVAPVPPEEFLIERGATCVEDALFTAHRMRRTVSDLLAEGYDPEKVKAAALSDDEAYNDERHERLREEDVIDIDRDTALDETTRYVWVIEAYLRVDFDGDGFAEMRRVVTVGDSQYDVLENDEVDDNPFASLTPIIMPHKFHGMSIADQTMDLQDINSVLWRQTLDNLYLSNAPRSFVQGDVNMDDVLGPVRAGGVIRGGMNSSLTPIVTPFVARDTFQMMEYVDAQREQRTGVTRYSQGLDANSLNKTATGIGIIQNAAQQRQELIARVFAETGVKRMFRLILRNVTKYQSKPRMIRLRDNWVPMDPRQWKHTYDMTVTVGLGTGNKEQQLGAIMNMLSVDQQIIQLQGGLEGPLVTAKNLYNKLGKLVEASGLKSVETYYTDPEQAQQQPQQPKPDPEMAKAQADIEREQQKAQRLMEIKEAEAARNMQMKENEAALDAQITRDKANADIAIMWEKAEAQAEIDKAKAIANAEIEGEERARAAEADIMDAAVSALTEDEADG